MVEAFATPWATAGPVAPMSRPSTAVVLPSVPGFSQMKPQAPCEAAAALSVAALGLPNQQQHAQHGGAAPQLLPEGCVMGLPCKSVPKPIPGPVLGIPSLPSNGGPGFQPLPPAMYLYMQQQQQAMAASAMQTMMASSMMWQGAWGGMGAQGACAWGGMPGGMGMPGMGMGMPGMQAQNGMGLGMAGQGALATNLLPPLDPATFLGTPLDIAAATPAPASKAPASALHGAARTDARGAATKRKRADEGAARRSHHASRRRAGAGASAGASAQIESQQRLSDPKSNSDSTSSSQSQEDHLSLFGMDGMDGMDVEPLAFLEHLVEGADEGGVGSPDGSAFTESDVLAPLGDGELDLSDLIECGLVEDQDAGLIEAPGLLRPLSLPPPFSPPAATVPATLQHAPAVLGLLAPAAAGACASVGLGLSLSAESVMEALKRSKA